MPGVYWMKGFSVIWSTMPNIYCSACSLKVCQIHKHHLQGIIWGDNIRNVWWHHENKVARPGITWCWLYLFWNTASFWSVVDTRTADKKDPIPVFQNTGHGDGTLYFLFHRYLVQILVQRLVTTTQFFFRGSPLSLHENAGTLVKWGQIYFLLHPFHFTTSLMITSFNTTNLSYWNCY